MNREDAKKNWSVIKAFSEGETVQIKIGAEWQDIHYPAFTGDEYRIKPKLLEGWTVVRSYGLAGSLKDTKKEAEEFLQSLQADDIVKDTSERVIHMREIEDDS